MPKRRPWYQRGEDLEGSERKMSEGNLGRRTYRRRLRIVRNEVLSDYSF